VFRHVPLALLLVVCLSCDDGTRPIGPPAETHAHAIETSRGGSAISPEEGTIAPGETLQFTASLVGPVTWTSSNTGVATVNASGLATGVAVGTTTITAHAGRAFATASLTVASDTPPPGEACAMPPSPGIERASLGQLGATPVTPVRRVVLMGGASEVDPAARQFVEGANGGDVLTLRVTGSITSYNSYFYQELGAQPQPRSVTTIATREPAAGSQPDVLCFVDHADAIWLAGGNQWNYLGEWPAELHAALRAATERGAALGGTSAGAASLSEMTFDARNGSLTSSEALADPFHHRVTFSPSPFGQPELHGFLADQHFSQSNREGRLLVLLARWLVESGRDEVFGIGLDERASIVIEDGSYRVLTGISGRYVFLYRVRGPVNAQPGVPLDLYGIERVRLSHNDIGAWPPNLDNYTTVHLEVVNGVVLGGGTGR
jgi:cyanophycinase